MNKLFLNNRLLYSSLLVLFVFISCRKERIQYNHKIVENGIFNSQEIKSIQEPEKALLLGYLAIYGNDCSENTDKVKCQILSFLKIDDECKDSYQLFLKQWFEHDIIKNIKLKNCPVLANKSAIQNKIKKIKISRNNDTIQIIFQVIGMNTSQEKNWDIVQTERFRIKDKTFFKIN